MELRAYPTVRIPQGTFTMGSNRFTNSLPMRRVTLAAYDIGIYAVSNLLYCTITGKAVGKDDALPVVGVSWRDAVRFCEKLSKGSKGLFGKANTYRLPTEAEWERAAAGLDGNRFPWGNTEYTSGVVCYNRQTLATVYEFPAGKTVATGIYQMAGNVWELCHDWYGAYKPGDTNNPKGRKSGEEKVMRGGAALCVYSHALDNTARNAIPPNKKRPSVGFRMVTDASQE